MFEVMVFGFMEHLYSGREIAKACQTDIRFLWLLNGEPAPSHATISRFEDEKLSEAIEGLFYQFVNKLYEMGEIKFKNLFVDGTKIEAYAKKYTQTVDQRRSRFGKSRRANAFLHRRTNSSKRGQKKKQKTSLEKKFSPSHFADFFKFMHAKVSATCIVTFARPCNCVKRKPCFILASGKYSFNLLLAHTV